MAGCSAHQYCSMKYTVHSIQYFYKKYAISATCEDIFTQNWYQNSKPFLVPRL